jgi:tetratricopeptide (TPR) repeat protein
MLFAARVPDPMPTRRLAGLGVSAALHGTVILLGLSSPQTAPTSELQASAVPSGDRAAVEVFQAPRSTAPDAHALTRRPTLELAGISVDLDKIRGTPADVFPFVLLNPVERMRSMNREDDNRRLSNPLMVANAGGSSKPLQLSDRELQALVDRAWSRRERWQPFAPLMELVEAHDGDEGRAADLLRAYSDQNLLQPYYDADTLDARYWTMLGLAADHRTFLGRVMAYLRERPHTRVTTELLFLLDELVQGSRDTLLMVVGNDPAAALRRSAAEQPAAYARAEELLADTRGWLNGLGLRDGDAIRRRLDEVRLDILRAVVERTPGGYRAADAQYLIGVIYFEQRDRERATAAWSSAVHGPHDLYKVALAEVQAALRLPPDRRVAALVAALGAEHGRWLDFSERRLRRFGHQPTDF